MILTATRAGDPTDAQRFETGHGIVIIGRGADCDWTLPDPHRLLSKRHCRMSLEPGGWQVTDLSSNGMTLNGQALRQGAPQPLRHGDRLGMGAYEIVISLESDVEPAADAFAGIDQGYDSPFGHDPAGQRRVGDPFVAPGAEIITEAFDVGLPPAFGLSSPAPGRPGAGPHSGSAPDAVSDLQASFTPPRPAGQLLPEDWDAEPATSAPSQATGPAPASPPLPPTTSSPFEDDASLLHDAPLPSSSVPDHVPDISPPTPSIAPAPPPAPPAEPVPPAERGAAEDAAMRAFAAFARGAGLDGVPREAPEVALEQLGRAFRAYVVGLRRLMIARATVKGEFRIDQTMIRPFGNNPLKFATDDDDAMAALLGIGRQVGMSPEQAVADSLRDVRSHELALTRALNEAVRQLLADLAPQTIAAEMPAGPFDLLPLVRDTRAWRAYGTRHARTVEALDDSLEGVFGQAFARAYGAALNEIQAGDLGDEVSGPAARPGRRA